MTIKLKGSFGPITGAMNVGDRVTAAPVPTDYKAYWSFNNNQTVKTRLEDLSGNDNTATLMNSPTTNATGKFDEAYTFNGSTQYCSLVNTSDIQPTGSFTLSGWVKTTGTATQALFQSYNNTPANGILIMLENDGRIYAQVSNYGDTSSGYSTSSVNDGNWHFVTVTYDGTNIKVYANATLENTILHTDGIAYSGTSYSFIGRYRSDNSGILHYFNGSVDDFKLYHRALTQAEVTALYNHVPSAIGFSWASDSTTSQRTLSSDIAAGDFFGIGQVLSNDGQHALIAAQSEDTNGADAGSVYYFTRSGNTWTQQQKFQSSDIAAGDTFGKWILMTDDNTSAIISASNKTGGGGAYYFTRSGNTWTQQQKIVSSDMASGDYFGNRASMTPDGLSLIIAADGDDSLKGAAYFFTRSGNTWTQQQKITASDGIADSRFGVSTEISGDGQTAIIGAFADDSYGLNAGQAYLFTRSGNTWTQQQIIRSGDLQASTLFGHGIALSNDGQTAIIGAYSDDAPGANEGSAYYFTRSANTFTQQQKLTLDTVYTNVYFGGEIKFDAAATTCVIAVSGYNSSTGAAQIWRKIGGVWSSDRRIDGPSSNTSFGAINTISADGKTMLISAHGDDANGTDAGAAYFYMI